MTPVTAPSQKNSRDHYRIPEFRALTQSGLKHKAQNIKDSFISVHYGHE